ncbi:hypothetical protein OG413_43955 [Streptomyces sp. NBC_01433]|uniref:hypothetical protein n=1 Tax=Streptomyces sp. NBC_01433 TaxID=2903864 RepID=UPI0022513E61|nr:hypothetical protein [Streptomyces sp. NBC_01433]MCX4682140.1 hypothetical protein [Streptomyces sp. NBC_01433]
MAFALAAVGAGYGREYLKTALQDPTNALGETFRARMPRWQDAEVERLWSLALSRSDTWGAPRIRTRKEALARVSQWIASLDSEAWRGVAGGTDKAVCEALGRIAYSQGGVDFAAGLSVIAIAAGVCEATARASLKRIKSRGFLRLIETHTATTAARYRLEMPTFFSGTSDAQSLEPPCGIDTSTGVPTGLSDHVDLGSDAARWRAIGKPAMLAWRVLDGVHAAPVASIAAALQVSQTAARLRLRKLQQHGLAEVVNGLWIRAFGDLDVLAAKFGTKGDRARQVQRLLQHRENRRTLRELWSSAFRFFVQRARTEGPPESEADPLPEWISRNVPQKVISSWQLKIHVRQG